MIVILTPSLLPRHDDLAVQAVEAFEDSYLDDNDEISEDDENRASRYATFSFFGGILVTALLEALVRRELAAKI